MLNYVEYGKENKYDDDIFFQKYLSANSVNSYATVTVSTLKRKYVPTVLNRHMYATDAVK